MYACKYRRSRQRMDRVTWSRISSWTLGIGGSFGEEIARCYSPRSTPPSRTAAPTPLFPVKLRLKLTHVFYSTVLGAASLAVQAVNGSKLQQTSLFNG